MLRNNKDIMLFSVGVAIAVFAVFFAFDKNVSGGIFGFLSGFFTAFFLLIREHRRQNFTGKAKAFLHKETVLFAGNAQMYDGNIAVKGCAVLTLGNFYFLGLTTDKNFSIVHSFTYKDITDYTYGRIVTLCCNDLKLELKIKDALEFHEVINEKL